ncbi:hypothetical protein HOP60_09690 [Halomonas daqingensis]|uniref:Uncharacterized protein n=1 Tax=Billgrantia desiderata TaxID=52021 RepID=A0ABS9B481_9GAMM|nr:hypothetical protein [Halomonas desiderata]MCE8042424.1 hypothetical protein [Halomonas desiderata]MCE8046999.1 hypothetical protein [Halomonas desiderata]
MKIKLLAGPAPDYYVFSGETVTAFKDGAAEVYDLSGFPDGGVFQGADTVGGVPAIYGVERVGGELHLTLAQRVVASKYPDKMAHWRGQQVIDAADYDPDTCYVTPTGMAGVEDYEIVRGTDAAGVEGWTVRKIATAEETA